MTFIVVDIEAGGPSLFQHFKHLSETAHDH